jgi:hypothetical protein
VHSQLQSRAVGWERIRPGHCPIVPGRPLSGVKLMLVSIKADNGSRAQARLILS